MSNYYALVAGLPNIAFEDNKITYTIEAFKTEIDSLLSKNDKKLIDLFFLKFDNSNLLLFLKDPDSSLNPIGNLSSNTLNELLQAVKDQEPEKENQIPPYFRQFISSYLEERPQISISWEDQLSSLYYAYAMRCGNMFVANWFELNLNINNILTAFTCRKHDLDKNQYIVGKNELADMIRNSNARDFGLADSVEYFPILQRIAEESDLMEREKKIDLLKWNWLEENTFFHYFSVEKIFAYILKLEMIERWTTLDKESGEKIFREIIQGLKKESLSSLEEFKRNNN